MNKLMFIKLTCAAGKSMGIPGHRTSHAARAEKAGCRGKPFAVFLLRLILMFKVYVWRFVSLNTVEHEMHCAANKQQQLQQQ
jgi:hypothetical protein